MTFGGIRAPSTLGSFLRAFNHDNVRQLAAMHHRVLARLAEQTPLLPGAQSLAFVDVDSVQRRVYGATKQGAAFGHAKVASKSLLVRGLNALAATVSTPLAAPVVTAARLRGGNAGSARGAASLVAEAIATAQGQQELSPPTGITPCSPTAPSADASRVRPSWARHHLAPAQRMALATRLERRIPRHPPRPQLAA